MNTPTFHCPRVIEIVDIIPEKSKALTVNSASSSNPHMADISWMVRRVAHCKENWILASPLDSSSETSYRPAHSEHNNFVFVLI